MIWFMFIISLLGLPVYMRIEPSGWDLRKIICCTVQRQQQKVLNGGDKEMSWTAVDSVLDSIDNYTLKLLAEATHNGAFVEEYRALNCVHRSEETDFYGFYAVRFEASRGAASKFVEAMVCHPLFEGALVNTPLATDPYSVEFLASDHAFQRSHRHSQQLSRLLECQTTQRLKIFFRRRFPIQWKTHTVAPQVTGNTISPEIRRPAQILCSVYWRAGAQKQLNEASISCEGRSR